MQKPSHLRSAFLKVFRDVLDRDMKGICLGFLGSSLEYREISKLVQPEMSQEFIEYLDREESLVELQDYLSKNHPSILKKIIAIDYNDNNNSRVSQKTSAPAYQNDRSTKESDRSRSSYEYNFAISFAGEDRIYALNLYKLLKAKGIKAFYDFNERSKISGTDFYQYSQMIYRDQAQFCVIFISKSYVSKDWTMIELEHAQARRLEQRNYIIPIRLDDTEVLGINQTTGFFDMMQHSPNKLSLEEVADLLEEKLLE